jgi:hypothetical protein
MKAELFTTCDFAQDNGGKLTLVGTFDSITVRSFPIAHPFMCIVCRIRYLAHELGPHTVRVDFSSPDGAAVIPPMESQIQLNNLSEDSGITNFVLQLGNVTFSHPGKHRIRLLMDGAEIGEQPLYVKKA